MQWDQALLRRGIRLEYATLGWNVVGTVVVIASAIAARSVALAGFGLDSLIEIAASAVVIWELTGGDDLRERRALRLIGWAFLALAVYIAVQAVYVLATISKPETSVVGIVWTAATFVAMVCLAQAKGHTGRALGNRVLETEARVTMIDAYLAGAVLVGLLLNAVAGVWWADPLAGLVIVFYGTKEGLHALREASVQDPF